MGTARYEQRRSEIETYFDRTAAAAWSALTSTDPVGRIRQTVRAGRDRMRQTLLDCLPADLSGMRLLDAGCGTGAACDGRGMGRPGIAESISVGLSMICVELSSSSQSRSDSTPAVGAGVGEGAGAATATAGMPCAPCAGIEAVG